MNKPRKPGLWFTVVALALVIVADIVLFLTLGGDGTISHVALYAGLHSLLLPFALGALMGHLMWPQRTTVEKRWTVWVLGGLGLVFLGHDIARAFMGWTWFVADNPIIALLCGIPAGH